MMSLQSARCQDNCASGEEVAEEEGEKETEAADELSLSLVKEN